MTSPIQTLVDYTMEHTRMMGAGQIAGLWDVITPATLGIVGEQADQFAGSGSVTTAGLKDAEVSPPVA